MTSLETLLARRGDVPTLDDLGGEERIWAQADQLAASKLWFRAAEVLLAGWDRLAIPDRAASFITEALTYETRPGVVGDVLDRLCDHSGYLASNAAALNRLALRRAERNTAPLQAETAGLFLEAALRLALAGTTKRYGLLDLLVNPQTTDTPIGYTRRAVRALGAAYEQWRDPDLTAALYPFLDIPELRSDAAYELAMCHLSDAFNAPDRASLLTQLETSRSHFDDAIAAEEDRPDATAYQAAINAVLAFEAGDNETLTTQAAQLRRTITEHALWLRGLRTGWRDGRYDTEAAWYTLSIDLEQAATHLSEPLTVWPNQTIQHILAAYAAHRSVRLTTTGRASALQFMVAPRIEAAFAARDGLLLHLRGLLADAPADWGRGAAEQLLSATESMLELQHEEPAEDCPGKDVAAAYPQLAAALGSQTLVGLPIAMLQSVYGHLTDTDLIVLERLPLAEQEIYNEVVSTLNDCPDFRLGSVRQHFVRLITLTIRFLSSRTNRGRAHHTNRTAYLFAPAKGENLPLENAVQEDLEEWLDGNLEDVDIEIPDRAGGRADIVVRFPGFETIIECKRTKGQTTRKGLRRYLGQTAAYQAAGVTLGMLVVLDLTPKADWIPNVRDNMWATRIAAPNSGQRDRWAVVMRVPGNRTTPHEM